VRPRLKVGCPCGWRGYRVRPDSRPCPACHADPEKIETLWLAGHGPHQSVVYLLHFRWPQGRPAGFHADHYCGATRDLPQRLRAHQRGQGARLVAAAVQAGAVVELARLWHVPMAFERRLKQRRPYSESARTRKRYRRGCATSLRRLCPTCVGPAAYGRMAEAKIQAGYRAQRQQSAAEAEARRALLARYLADRAAGVWDAEAAWPAEWDRHWPAA
jgi:predicted GIY-YIG superfamily endonuclease